MYKAKKVILLRSDLMTCRAKVENIFMKNKKKC